jgi:hypothetical protein
MWKSICSVCNQFKEFFTKYVVIISIIFGFSCLFSWYLFYKENSLLFEFGKIILTGGLFAVIVKSNLFAEIFKTLLRDIIYGTEHLENRKDLEKIWKNVTEVLSNQKFKNISEKMQQNIKKYFLPLDHDYYYDDFSIEINIEYADLENYIVVNETISYTIVSEDENLEIDNKFKSGINIDITNISQTSYKLISLKVDNKNLNTNVETVVQENILWISHKNKLKDKKRYFIKREEEKIYNLNFNSIRIHSASWVYNGCKLDITYPLDMHIKFYNMGLLNSFSPPEDKHKNNKNKLSNRLLFTYEGLIYKNQGFFLHLTKK